MVRAAALGILRSRHSEYVFERQRFTRARLADPMRAAGRILREIAPGLAMFLVLEDVPEMDAAASPAVDTV